MKDRIIKSEKIAWQQVKDLQPDDVKLPTNLEDIKASMRKFGFAKAYDVWQDPEDGSLYWLDGHTRTQALNQMKQEGEEVPAKLTANFVECKDRKEAIKILIEVHNQKQNPFFENTLTAWLDLEEIEVEDIGLETINYTEKRYVKDFEFKPAQTELENEYDDSESEMQAYDEEGNEYTPERDNSITRPNPEDPNAEPSEPTVILLPFFTNISKRDNSLFEKYRKQEKLSSSDMLVKMINFYHEQQQNQEEAE